MSTNIRWALNKVRAIWSTRPRSALEFYECIRDDIIFMPQFQWVWWWTGCCVVFCEYALAMTTEFCLMSTMCYVLFTLPCLRFCTVWTKLYQQRRNQKPPDEEKAEVKEVKQKKKKAMTEEEMLEATRKRQKNRAGDGATKGFGAPKKKKERGAKKAGKKGGEANVAGVITELQIKTVKH